MFSSVQNIVVSKDVKRTYVMQLVKLIDNWQQGHQFTCHLSNAAGHCQNR